MGPDELAFFGVIALIVGIIIGWHGRSTRGAHGDMKSYKSRVPVLRKARNQNGFVTIALAVMALLVLSAFLRH